jgi:tubulin-specific chaperone A
LLGARIVLKSKEGAGSTFSLLVPEFLARTEAAPNLAAPPQPIAMVSPESEPGSPPELFADDRSLLKPGDKSILIIESDKATAEALLNFSRERGFLGVTAFDGKTGLHFADYYQPSAIILDVGCAEMDGWSVLARLKENQATRHIPTHVMSAADRDSQAMKMGAVDVLAKPVTMSAVAGAFERIEKFISKKVRQLLLVEDDPDQRAMIKSLLEGNDIGIVEAATGSDARRLLHEREFECMVLDLGLPDMDGTKLLMELRADDAISKIPVIVYTGLELPSQTLAVLDAYAEKVIFKGVRSGSKLIDDAALFLHRVEQNMPEEKQRMIRLLHDQEAIFKNKRILIVDDDMRNVYALSNILENKGLSVTAASNGRECLDVLARDARYSLVLMDIMMPALDGYETMREIRKDPRFAKLPLIALTAKAMKGDRALCIEAGASDYLAKPVEAEKLFSMLRVWLYQ